MVAAALAVLPVVSPATPAAAASCTSLDPFAGGWADTYLTGLGGQRVAASVEDLSTGCRFHLGTTAQLPPASVAKAQILGAALLRLQDTGATVVPAWLDALARPMITVSDNDAADALYDTIGGGAAMAAYGRRLGMVATGDTAYSWGGEPTTSDDQLTLLSSLLAGGGVLRPAFVAYARSLLGAVDRSQAWGVSAGLPSGARVYLKNGWLLNDGTMWGSAGRWRVASTGMVELANGRRYTIALLGDEWTTMAAGITAIETLAAHVAPVLAAARSGSNQGDAGAAAADAGGAAGAAAGTPVGRPAVFTAVSPTRLADTRVTGGRIAAGGTLAVDLSAASIPDDGGTAITAVALNVTAVDPAGSGYVTLYTDGTARPLASNLNPVAGRVTANVAVVAVGGSSRVQVYASTDTHAVIDLLGYWREAPPDADGGVAAGRITAVTPARLFDSRAVGATVPAGGTVTVPVAGRGGLPTVGAAAAVVTVTATDAAAGYWTVWPWGTARPLASNLNTATGETAANTTMVPIGDDGSIALYSQSGGNVVVDVVGWVTGPDAGPSTAGELVVLPTPVRVIDSRFGDGGIDRLGPWSTATVDVSGAGVPASASAVFANLTYAAPASDGYLTAFPAGSGRPGTSTANPSTERGSGANAMLTAVSGGAFELYASASTDAVVDVWGWLSG